MKFKATLFDLLSAFKSINDRDAEIDPEDVYETVEEETVTVEDKIEFIDRQLAHSDQQLFEDLFPLSSSKTDRIVTFLVILEMIRNRKNCHRPNRPF